MRQSIKIFFIAIILIINSCVQENSHMETRLLKEVSIWLEKYNVPAAGIGVIENGKIVFLKVFGELQDSIPAHDNAIFNVASVTKTITTMLTLKLVNDGQWSLQEPLANYWIDPDIANDPYLNELTTYHVLTHQSGFLNWRWNNPTYKLTFEFRPGTKYMYSGEAYEYLRHAIENKFNKPFEKLVDSLIFKPIGMSNSRLSWDNTVNETGFAEWHDANGKKYEFSEYFVKETGVNAADDLLTTVEDYCKFGIYVMNGSQISKELFNQMVTPQSNILEHSATGLGWFLLNGLPNEEYAIQHSGSDYGVKTIAIFLPKSKRGIVVFTNGDNGLLLYNKVIQESFDIGKNIYEYLYQRPNIPEVVDISDKTIEKYIGLYQESDGRQHLLSKNGDEILFSGGGWATIVLFPQAENKFFVKEFDMQFELIDDSTGLVNKLIVYQNGNKYAELKKIE